MGRRGEKEREREGGRGEGDGAREDLHHVVTQTYRLPR